MSILVNGIIYLFLFLFLLDPPGDSQKDPMKWVYLSFCPSFRVSWHFLGTVSLVFSKFLYVTRNPYEVAHGRAEFSGKSFFVPKIGEIAPKWAKNGFF